MYLKSLQISNGDGSTIRKIDFHLGLNLIVDETSVNFQKKTGNNVGKTTVIQLIDFCLGAKKEIIYTDQEDRTNINYPVKDFLLKNNILITLVLRNKLVQENTEEVTIKRNFLANKNKIQQINGIQLDESEFKKTLTDMLFPGHYDQKPTFKQIISHNIRYKELSTTTILKTLDKYSQDDEYETLYLFLLGLNFKDGGTKQEIRTQISIEEKFKNRLEEKQTKSLFQSSLSILKSEILDLEQRKKSFNLNPNLLSDLDELNQLKFRVNQLTSEIGIFELRKKLILEAQGDLRANISTIDINELQQIYQQAKVLVTGIQKTFQDLNEFHNKMIESKIRFISQELPSINEKISRNASLLKELILMETQLKDKVLQSETFEDIEQIIADMNAKYELKGEYEHSIQQIESVEQNLTELNKKLTIIDTHLFSHEFQTFLQEKLDLFNQYYSYISNELYGEKYVLSFKEKIVKNRPVYIFASHNFSFGSGKKLGEMTCFDLAYILYADSEKIPCMHFLLNDKKELMSGNQLKTIADFVNKNGIQFVIPILRDKLPAEIDKEEYIVLSLSQTDKLFRIENS